MRAHCVIFTGCTLLLSVSSSAYSDSKPDDKAKNEDASLLQLLADATTESEKTQQGASEEVVNMLHDLRQKIEEGNGLVDEDPDDGIIKTEGCEGHQDGDEWGTSDHANCHCQGQDRFCYHVDCLPGSEVVRDSDGLWDCPDGFTSDETTESKKTQQGASEEVVNILHDLRQKIEEGNGLEDPDDGIFQTEGCEDHQDGDQWGTSDHDNCYCQEQDRFCYRVDCLPGSEIVRKSDGLWDCPDGFTSGEENTTDLGGPDDAAEVPPVAEKERSLVREVADDGLTKTEGCQGHQVGDQWGTPEHDNCICTGSDRYCYRVNCLPGSEVVRDSIGPWNCDVGLSKRSITGSALMMQDSEKRVIATATVLAAFGVFSGLVGITNFIWSRVGAAKTTRQLNEIQDQIRALDKKVDELTQSVSGLQLGQQYLQQVILYGRDELRLRNMLDTLAKMQVNNGQYTGIHDTEAWADSVLSHGSDGVQQVLYNLLDMVKPQSVLFGGKSLFEIYHEQLRGNIPEYREKMPRKVTQVYGLIGGGYAVWITALRIKGRTGEIPAKTQEAQQKLQSLEPNLEKYFKYGSCPSGWQRRTSTCYKAFSLSKTWTDASAYCSNQGPGGMLAMAKDSGTNGFLISLKDAESSSWGFWFGLNDRAREGSYKWPDGTSLGSYKYWSPIEPNNGGKNWWGQYNNPEDCVEFFRTGWRNSNWNDAKCGNRRYFICERKPEGV